MAEFGMNKDSEGSASFTNLSGANVDWYTPSTSNAYSAYGTSAHNNYTGYQTNTSTSYGGPATSFDDEPPLLEELGIDIPGILSKTRSIVLHRLNSKVLEDLDMGGALLFIFVLGGLHLLMGKLHFGVILGWSVVHSAVLWFIVNQLAGVDASEGKGLDLYSVCGLVGYCMVPIVLLSVATLMVPKGLLTAILGVLCTVWSGSTAAKVFVRRCPMLEEVKGLITFPCVLLYAAFAILTLY